MIFYPSSETKTKKRSFPWASLLLVVFSVIGYLFLVQPMASDRQKDLARAETIFWQAVEAQFKAGTLEKSFMLQVREDPATAGLAQNRDIFSDEVRKAYRDMVTQPLTMERVLNLGSYGKPASMFAPANLLLLIPGCVFLLLLGYVFEHRYDRQLVLALFILSGFLWSLLEGRLPEPWWPSPVFSWMWAVTVFLWVGALTSPGASVIVTVRAWLVQSFIFKPKVPIIIFPAAFTVGALAFAWFGPYASFFHPESLIAVFIQISVFSLIFMMFSPRITMTNDDPESLVNQQISAVGIYYGEEKYEQGTALLADLMNHQPNAEQLSKMIDLAWHQDETDLVEKLYAALLKRAIASNDYFRILEVVEEMALRRLAVPGRSLLNLLNISLRQEQIRDALKLLPHLRENKEVGLEEKLGVYQRLVEMMVRQPSPDFSALKVMYGDIGKLQPDSDLLGLIKTCFGKRRRTQAPAEAGPAHVIQIEKIVGIELHSIGISNLEICVSGKKMQRVPWTAVLGVFGCHMKSEQRGWRGCIIIKFQRKIFGCTFEAADIKVQDRFERTMSFEETWSALQDQVPDDLPFQEMKDFGQIKTEEDFQKQLTTFVNMDHASREIA